MEKFLMRQSTRDALEYLRDLRPVCLDVDLEGGYVIYRRSRLALDAVQVFARVKGEENDQRDLRWPVADVTRLRLADWDLEVVMEALPTGGFRTQTWVRVHNSPRLPVVDHHHRVDNFTKADFTARAAVERGEDISAALLKGPSDYIAELHVRLTNFFAHGTPSQRARAKSTLSKLPVLHG